MGLATSKGNEVKSKTKQPSDMPTPRFEHGGSDLWSNTLPLDHGVIRSKKHLSLSKLYKWFGAVWSSIARLEAINQQHKQWCVCVCVCVCVC